MMMEEVLVPFVEKSIQDEGLEEDSLSWLTLDGESTQINPVMKDRIQQLLKENNLIVTKPPGSTSSITQPADVGNSFKSIRSNIKSLEKLIFQTSHWRIYWKISLNYIKNSLGRSLNLVIKQKQYKD
jgi:hypothetical protein